MGKSKEKCSKCGTPTSYSVYIRNSKGHKEPRCPKCAKIEE